VQKAYRIVVFILFLVLAESGGAALLSQQDAVLQGLNWMSGNPVMSQASETVASVSTFSGDGTYFVYVVELSPSGYLILNSDDRLPLIFSFSADSTINLSENPQNALRVMLLEYCDRMEDELNVLPLFPVARALAASAETEPELYGPFLETSWSQNDPYNLFCPDDPSGSEYYGYRAPSGCVPTAFAQMLNFHRWPVHGTGSRSYSDSSGSITGSHSADFSDSYDWGNVKNAHSSSDSQSEQEAIAELMVELGVAVGADYESEGTSSSTYTLGTRLNDYFFFEPIVYSSSQSALISPMEADLRAGFPCIVSIPGHAIVADGLMVDGGTKTYHINYGWGGQNNGWFSASGIPGGSLQTGITSIRPMLMAFPEADAVSATNGSAELQWIFPKRLEDDVSKLTIKRYVSGNWETFHEDIVLASHRFAETITERDDCDDFSVFEVTSTSTYKDWGCSTTSGVSHCFYKESGGYNNREYHLTSLSTITPTESTRLLLSCKYSLYQDPFRVMVSTDRVSFNEIWSTTGSQDWGDIAVDLSAYAGQEIYVRLEYVPGSYYIGGGVWIDSISTQEVVNPEQEGQPLHYTQLAGLSAGIYTLAAVLTDTSAVEHTLGPSFTLTVTESSNDLDEDGLPDNWELQYFGGETNANPSAIAANGLNTLMETYIAGINPTNAAVFFTASVINGPGFIVEWNATSGRVYSVFGSTSLAESFQPLETNILWPQSSWTDTVDRAECFYKVGVELVE
jgi:hypothetical protein